MHLAKRDCWERMKSLALDRCRKVACNFQKQALLSSVAVVKAVRK